MKKLTSLVSLISLWALPLAYSGSASADMILTYFTESNENDGVEFEIDPDDGLIITEQLDNILGIDVTYLSNVEGGATVDWVFDADGDDTNGYQLINPQSSSGGLEIFATDFKDTGMNEAVAGTWSWTGTGTLDYLTFKFDTRLAVYQISDMTSGNWSVAGICGDALTGGFITDQTGCLNNGNLFALSHSKAYTTSVIPVPAAVWLFGSGLLGLIGIARRR